MEAADQQAQKQLQLQKQMQLKRQQLEKQKMQMKQQGKLPVNTESLDAKVAKTIVEKLSTLSERGDFWHPDPEKDRKLGGPGANARAREDRADASEPKKDYSKTTKPGESYMDFAKRKQAETSKSSTKYPPEIQKRLDAAKAKRQQATRSESAVPGQPAERLGAVTAIPSDEREAAKQRTLAKAAALRKKREEQKEEVEHVDEALTGERYKKAIKKPGARSYSRMVSADPKKRATRGGRGGESDFGAGDRGSGNKAARRAGKTVDEEFEIEEGMTMKDFKVNRQKNKRRESSADAEKRGHVGKEWYNSGRKYSPDEAKRSRAKMDDEERRTRHRSAVDPDNEDDNNYSADRTKNPKKQRKQKAMGEGYLSEKSLSRAQQRFMGMVYAAKKGETSASPEVAKAASGMSKKSAKDFAGTKHKGLPEKKVSKEEFEQIDERRKEDKAAGTPRKPRDRAFEYVAKMMGSNRLGVQPRGKKKEPGKKPPKAGEYGGPVSPAQKVAKRRAAAQRAQDNMSSRYD
jgi:hypothetical protein